MIRLFIISAFILLSSSLFSQLEIDSTQSKVEFDIRKFKKKRVFGTITGMFGTIQFDPENLDKSLFDVCVDISTIKTGNSMRNNHLKNKDEFFQVDSFPNICFKSSLISKTDNGYEALGVLTMKGVSLDFIIPFTYSNKTFKSTFELIRTAFGIGGESGYMIGKEVNVSLTCTLK